ncbi:MAG: DUF4468 domain-containing protein [Paludibacteraceae bacterium]|nr:DUF4468 domain-containing protein [Paludibacteraceae bacterium]
MKKVLSALMLCFVSIMTFSQEIKETAIVFPEYQGIVTSSIPASDLYNKAKLWIAENFRSANDVIQLDSPETNTIVCKGIYVYNAGKFSEMRVHITLKIEGKDNRFRYTITINDLRGGTQDMSAYSMYAKNPEGKYTAQFSNDFRIVIKDWMSAIASATVNDSSNEDW